jgi:hypothetical protein
MTAKEESFLSRNGLWIGIGALGCAVTGYVIYRLAQEEDPLIGDFKSLLEGKEKVPTVKETIKGKEIEVIEFEFFKKIIHKI